jgi:two-component system sensor histidine kinase RegB
VLAEDYSTDINDRQGHRWLWHLRWGEVAGLLLGALAAQVFLELQLPWGVIAFALITLLASNVAIHPRARFLRSGRRRRAAIIALLALDLVLLTALLYFTGGAHNPFTMLYLLLIVLAVMLLRPADAWFLVALTVVAFLLLFSSPHRLMNQAGTALCHDMDFHLKGMVLGLAVGGAGVVYFVSSLKRALAARHREVETLRQHMTEQSKLVELSAVAATVAHEVATPLGTIAVIGRDLETLDFPAPSSNELREDARLIREAVARCQNSLQWLSNRDYGSGEEETQLVSAALFYDQLSSFLNSHERARLRFDPDRSGRQSVRTSLRELILAAAILIRNGLDASSENQLVDLRWEDDAETVRISVSDTGCGMDRDLLKKARQPFFTTKSPDQGFGLGLYLVEMFSQRAAGSLELVSTPGSGTIATLRLPHAS